MIIYFKTAAKRSGKPLYANTEESRERLKVYEKDIVLNKEKDEAKKALKKAEKNLSSGGSYAAGSTIGLDDEPKSDD